MYDEKLFTLSTDFSTGYFVIISCRNSSYYSKSVVFRTIFKYILISTRYSVDDYTQFVCIFINMQKNAGANFRTCIFD
jgi:hypothetical protein